MLVVFASDVQPKDMLCRIREVVGRPSQTDASGETATDTHSRAVFGRGCRAPWTGSTTNRKERYSINLKETFWSTDTVAADVSVADSDVSESCVSDLWFVCGLCVPSPGVCTHEQRTVGAGINETSYNT